MAMGLYLTRRSWPKTCGHFFVIILWNEKSLTHSDSDITTAGIFFYISLLFWKLFLQLPSNKRSQLLRMSQHSVAKFGHSFCSKSDPGKMASLIRDSSFIPSFVLLSLLPQCQIQMIPFSSQDSSLSTPDSWRIYSSLVHDSLEKSFKQGEN